MSSAPPAIDIVGTGIDAARHMTRETVAVLERADCIVSIIQSPRATWLPPRALALPCHDLYRLYRAGRERALNYTDAALAATEIARGHRRTALVTPGAPSVYDRLVTLVYEHGARAGLVVRVHAAVSSIEGALALLGEDVAPGLRILEARWMLKKGLAFEPDLAHLVFQPGAIGTDFMPQLAGTDPANLAPLQRVLAVTYPADHPVLFVRAPGADGDAGYLRCATVATLCDGSPDDLNGTSLFIPALGYERYGWRAWHAKR